MLTGIRIRTDESATAAIAGRWLRDLGAAVGEVPLGQADAVVAGGAAARAAHQLAARHPRLIIAAITPFGLDGPRAGWRSCDTVAQAVGGMLLLNGDAGAAPLRAAGAQAYECAGLQAALGVALALLARARDGRGQVVDVSLHESVVASLEHVTGRYRADGTIAARHGSLHWSGAFRVGRCRDGPVLLSHLGDWTALREWLLADGAAGDLAAPHWQDEALRRAHAPHVFDVLDAWARRYRRADLLARAALLRLPFAAVVPAQASRAPWCNTQPGPRATRPPAAASQSQAYWLQHRDEAARRAGATPAVPAASSPLTGVRVLDFTWVVAGPLATRVLADFGAEVIKVERPDAADGATRRGGVFGNLNRGKHSLALDMRRAADAAVARQLAARADVVVDNFSPRVMANWRLDAAAIHATNPRAIVASLSAFGRGDARVGYGPTVQALAGFTWHMRHADGEPAGLGFAYADVASGYAAALAIAAALWRRQVCGGGARLDLAQLAVARRLLSATRLPDAAGNASPEGDPAPHGVYRCADRIEENGVRRGGGAEVPTSADTSARPHLRTSARSSERWLALAVFDDADWARLAALIDAPWTAEPRFATHAARRAHAAALDAQLAAWMRDRDAEALSLALQGVGLTAGVCADAVDLCDADPQLAARGYFVDIDGVWLDGPTPRLTATPGRVAAPGPRRDQHRAEVLRRCPAMVENPQWPDGPSTDD